MSETKRIRRSPQEILEAKENELNKAKARASVEQQMSHPLIQSLSNKIQEVTKSKAEASKGFSGNIGTRFDVRINSHQAWCNEIECERNLATAQIALSNYLSPLYREIRNSAATDLSNGMSADEVSEHIEASMDEVLRNGSNYFDAVNAAEASYENAQTIRKNYLATKKAGTTPKTQETSQEA